MLKKCSKHGLIRTRLYGIWHSMKSRCYIKTAGGYHNYGGRGIKVCPEWNDSFLSFREWAIKNGYNDGLSIDRIDVNGNYEPSNCRWATKKQQDNNRRTNHFIEHNGEVRTIKQWSELTGICYPTLCKRVRHHGNDPKKLFAPIRTQYRSTGNRSLRPKNAHS